MINFTLFSLIVFYFALNPVAFLVFHTYVVVFYFSFCLIENRGHTLARRILNRREKEERDWKVHDATLMAVRVSC
ncbi:hypothetical protein VNO77_23704 [Canavalia gladiata]|uniref:Uncharacterized protein n=1 Tax=Canavalia gladiata TaxID=3824 RepID=A0AAN9L5D4_CANGL